MKSVNAKGNQSWLFIGRSDAKAQALILWPPDAKSQLIGKDPGAGPSRGEEPNLSVQFSSVTQFCPTLCKPLDCSTPGFPVHHQLPEFTRTHAYWVGDAIQPSHPLSSPSPPALNLSQHQGLFQWVSYSHQVAKVLEFQLQHQSFQWIIRTDFLQDGLVWSPFSLL